MTLIFWQSMKLRSMFRNSIQGIVLVACAQGVLRCSETGFMVWLGVLCATWVSICRGTTMRAFLRPLGREELRCVQEGNQMGAVTALVCLLIFALSGDFCVEQPCSSLLFRHPRLQWLCSRLKAGFQNGQLQPNKILYVLNLKPKCSIRIQIIGPSGMESKLLDGLL